MNEDERNRLISTWGACIQCGEPRRRHIFHETDTQGREHAWTRLVCTADFMHSQDPRDLALIEGRG